MRTILKLGLLASIALFLACSASSKTTATPEEIAAMEKMISNKQFEIQAQWAQPMATQSLNSIANSGLLPPGSTASQIDISGT